MKRITLMLLGTVLIMILSQGFYSVALSQEVLNEFSLELLISDSNDNSVTLELGLHPDATDGYDADFDQFAPPPPPSGAFDARIQVDYEDYMVFYRPDGGTEAVWAIKVQPSSGGYPLQMSWNPADLPEGMMMRLEDDEENLLVSMNESGEYTIEQGEPLEMVILISSEEPPEADPPQLLTPAHEAEEVALPVVLSWEAYAGAESYYLEVSPVASFDTTLTVKALTETGFMVPDAVDQVVYYWRIRARLNGSWSPWSETRSFTTELRVPEVPEWSPFDGEEEVDSEVTLTWSPSLRASTYDVQLAESSDFESLVAEGAGLETTEFDVTDLPGATTFYWRVRAGNMAGYSNWSEVSSFTTSVGTEAERREQPLRFSLRQNYPNPFNPVTTIEYTLAADSEVHLQVYDMAGRRVAGLAEGRQQAGEHTVRFDASQLSSGIYIYRLQAGAFVETRRMTLVK